MVRSFLRDVFIVAASLALLALPSNAAQSRTDRPNILVVLLDDVGFMDIGAYGSDTRTPNIDKLGKAGVMLSRYYSSPLCGPSRASLLTGQDNHVVGAGTLAEALTPEMRQSPAYSMTWDDDQQTIATRLKQAGYQTFVTGKWGVGDIGVNLPHRFGFDRSWVLDATGASNYRAKPYLPLYKEVKWYEDGQRVSLPEDFYSSRAIVDKMIQYLDEADTSKPFFSYLSFMAVHIPVQAPKEFIDRYNGVFDKGWDEKRKERHQKAIDLGLVPAGAELADRAAGNRKWTDLDVREREYWARAMQTNAGMLEAADYHLGRLLEHLRQTGQLENTIVVVTSDNGPEYNSLGKTSPFAMRLFERAWMAAESWDVDKDNLGQRDSLAAIGAEWASVSAAPLHLFKFATAEGGMRVPFVMAGPGVENLGLIDGKAQVADITPTLLSVAGVPFDQSDFYGRDQMPLVRGETADVYGETHPFGFEVSGAAALYLGDWKITKNLPPYDDGEWKLFNIMNDPGELNDLSKKEPEIFQTLQAEYENYASETGVYQLPEGYSARKQLSINAISKILTNYWYIPLIGILSVLVLLYGCYRITKSVVRRLA